MVWASARAVLWGGFAGLAALVWGLVAGGLEYTVLRTGIRVTRHPRMDAAQ